MKFIFLTISILTITLMSCNNNTGHHYKRPVFPMEYSADITYLNEQVMFSFYSQPLLLDSLLIIPDLNQDSIIFIYNKNRGNFIKKLGSQGRGTGELLTPTKFSIDTKSHHFYIHDYGKNAIVKYDTDKLMNDSSTYDHEYALNKSFELKNKIAFLKDSLFYSRNKGTIQIFTLNKEIDSYHEIYPLPELTEKRSNSFLKNWTLDAVSPDGTKYVNLTSLGGIMDIYHLFPNIHIHQRHYFIEPSFSITSDHIHPTEDAVYGFNCVYASDEYVYATIFAEKSPQHYPSKIWQFDWEGNPIAEIKCPCEIGSFTVDEIHRKIYAIVLNSEHEEAIACLDITPSFTTQSGSI